MSIATTMTALANATGLSRKYDWPTDSVQVPCAVVSYPELDPNQVFTGGKGENVYPVFVLVGTAADKSARTLISTYVHDLPLLLNAVAGSGVDWVNVDTVTLREVPVAGTKYLGAIFSCIVMETL